VTSRPVSRGRHSLAITALAETQKNKSKVPSKFQTSKVKNVWMLI